MLGLIAQQGQPGTEQTQAGSAGAPPADDQAAQFVGTILGSTEDTWGKVFQQSGSTYPAPKLVLFSGAVASACGQATSAVGPFYCPGDRQVYLDTSFFEEMKARLGGGGDFAEAYVIAHEVGHHIQTITGVSAKIDAMRARGGNVEGDNGLLVRQELQADCYAGVWANQAQQQNQWLEAGRRRRSPQHRQRHRRRPPAEAVPRHRGARLLHPWHLGTARALVPQWLRERRCRPLRYLQGHAAVGLRRGQGPNPRGSQGCGANGSTSKMILPWNGVPSGITR